MQLSGLTRAMWAGGHRRASLAGAPTCNLDRPDAAHGGLARRPRWKLVPAPTSRPDASVNPLILNDDPARSKGDSQSSAPLSPRPGPDA